jgi:serine/threonine protein kinase
MEYLHGSSLRRLLRQGPVSAANTVSIIAAVSEGLHAAHLNNIIHRDLKPENILLPQHRSSMTVAKLVDFGIARIIDAPRITTTQHVMGTPQYIAPEQAMGKRVDHRADIYSLGVVMYEMLSGTLPFLGADPEFLLRQHISSPPPPLPSEQAVAVIPPILDKLIMHCLQKAPENRPSDMLDVMNYLKETQ